MGRATTDERDRMLTVLQAVAYMAWIDGRLAADEVSAARGVATVLGLAEPASGGPGLLARGPVDEAALGLDRLDHRERQLVYATAVWIALADGVVHAAEGRALRQLRERLDLQDDWCARIEDVVYAHSGVVGEPWERRYASVLHELGVY